jgi:hypothetical protein
LLLIALLSPLAHAHATALLEGLDVAPHALGGLAVETSFGLLWSESADPEMRWLCHEAVTAPDAIMTPRYSVSVDGTMLAAVPALEQTRDLDRPVYRTTDRCAWDPVVGLDGVVISDVAYDRSDAQFAVAISADLADGAENQIYRSQDAGQSFLSVAGAEQRLFRTVAWGPDGHVWVAAAWYATPGAWLLHSPDRGVTWTEITLPVPTLDDDIDVDVLAAGTGAAIVAMGPFGADAVMRVHADGTIEALAEPGAELTDAAVDDDGTVWLAGDGARFWSFVDGTLTELPDAPEGQGLSSVDGDLRLATRARQLGTQVALSTDGGAHFETEFHLSALQPPPTCPEDSPITTFCAPLWSALEARLPLPPGGEDTGEGDDGGDDGDDGGDDGGGDTATAPEPKDGGCGGGGGAAMLLLPLLLPWRRRP